MQRNHLFVHLYELLTYLSCCCCCWCFCCWSGATRLLDLLLPLEKPYIDLALEHAMDSIDGYLFRHNLFWQDAALESAINPQEMRGQNFFGGKNGQCMDGAYGLRELLSTRP